MGATLQKTMNTSPCTSKVFSQHLWCMSPSLELLHGMALLPEGVSSLLGGRVPQMQKDTCSIPYTFQKLWAVVPGKEWLLRCQFCCWLV